MNEMKKIFKTPPFNKEKWLKNISELNNIPNKPSDINNTRLFLYFWAAFSKLPALEKQKFLLDPKNGHFASFVNKCAIGISRKNAELISKLIINEFHLKRKPKPAGQSQSKFKSRR